MSFDSDWQPFLAVQEPEFRAVFATLVTHYWSNSAFGGDEIMDRMNRISHLPAVLIHGRLDISSPLETPWLLHRARGPAAGLVVLDEGHGGKQMIEQVMAAIADLG